MGVCMEVEVKRDNYCLFCLKINVCVGGGGSILSSPPPHIQKKKKKRKKLVWLNHLVCKNESGGLSRARQTENRKDKIKKNKQTTKNKTKPTSKKQKTQTNILVWVGD